MSQDEVRRAKYVQEHLPLSGEMLAALATYLREAGWQERANTFSFAFDREPVKVRLPITASTPTSIDAAEAFSDILLLLTIQQNKDLDTIIGEVRAVYERTSGAQSIQDANYTVLVNEAGLILYETPIQADEKPEPDSMLYLTPQQALRYADFINSHRAYLEKQHTSMEALFQSIAKEILEELGPRAPHFVERHAPWYEVRNEAYHAYITLVTQKNESKAEAWREGSYTDDFSHRQQEELIMRSFMDLFFITYPSYASANNGAKE